MIYKLAQKEYVNTWSIGQFAVAACMAHRQQLIDASRAPAKPLLLLPSPETLNRPK